jgi:enoyl-CoA hydratase/carnithine racemase
MLSWPDEPVSGGDSEFGVHWGQSAPGVLTVVIDSTVGSVDSIPEALRALARVGRRLTGDVQIVVVRIVGAETKTDRSRTATEDHAVLSEEACEAALNDLQDAFRWLRRNDLVSIAVLFGPVAGPGVHAALACDLRLLAADGSLALTETARGLVPALTGTGPLVDLIGVARATELCLTGRPVDATEAERLGLVTRVVPAADLPTVTADLVAGLLAVPRDAVVETKALLSGAPGRSRSDQEAAERAALARRLRDLAELGE